MTANASKKRKPKLDDAKTPVKVVERKLFGTDGIRGKANVFPMTPELALSLGKAITLVARKRNQGAKLRSEPRIVIGKDTRVSGYMLETALASGICSMGGTVLLTGPIPTPAVANLTHSMRADAGVVISASHNPYEDNGIKLFGPDGYKLPDDAELQIEALLEGGELDKAVRTGAQIGRAERIEEAWGRYVVYAKNTFPRDLALHGVRLVVDAANGAAYKVAPHVFEELGASVHAIGCSPNGRNINLRCGALHPEQLAREVLKQEATLGIALDGDADRLIVVDERGEVVDGDQLMAICAIPMLEAKRLPHATVVATVMSNLGLERALAPHGGKLVRTQVGDRYVVDEMRRKGYLFGGEQSGHLVFSEHSTTGDGIVAALQILATMMRAERPLSELKRCMTPVPQVLKNVKLARRMALEEMPALTKLSQATSKALGKEGRLLVRWSGTESKLRIMLEGPNLTKLTTLAEELANAAIFDAGGA
ncbi:MAG TPA: phosphoglucosamine mutase [Polyangiaceae bacterium]|nr:phosphoglucosamine mutase [Polyangiaceae bacterium]